MNECNPLLLNCKNSELQEYINHNKEIKEKVMEKSLDNKDWECCICLGGYIKEKNAGTNLVLRDNSVVELKSRGWGSKED